MNKKSIYRLFALGLFLLGTSVLFTSCNNDPSDPHDETEDAMHDDPAKAVLTLASGHFHGVKFHQDPEFKGSKHMKAVQTITYVYVKGKGWMPEEGSADKFVVTSGSQEIASAYGLWIKYYDKKGKEITGQFIENGQDKIHQHFFIAKDVQPFASGATELGDDETPNIFNYTYMDTTPWNKTLKDEGTQLTGKENPIGFKGWFNFLRPYKKMTMKIKLMHARKSKFNDKGETSPYYNPTPAQNANDHWDLEMNIPVYVIYSRAEDDKWESGKEVTYDQLLDFEKKIIDGIALVYGITPQEALEEYNLRLYGEREDHDSASLWF